MTKCVALLVLASAVGCTNKVYAVAQPSNITLENAMVQVVQGLKAMQDFEKNNPDTKLGAIIDEVDLNFQISTTAQNDGKLTVAVSAPAGAPIGGNLGFSNEEIIGAQRGSNIQVKLRSVITAPLNDVGCFYFRPDYYKNKSCTSSTSKANNTQPGGKPQTNSENALTRSIGQLAQQAVTDYGVDQQVVSVTLQ